MILLVGIWRWPMDIIEKLTDLHKQATTERSHYYVASCCREAIDEIERLRKLWQDAVDDKHAWAAREVRAERECCAEAAKPETLAQYAPTHGAWDRGYQQGRIDAADAIRARSA